MSSTNPSAWWADGYGTRTSFPTAAVPTRPAAPCTSTVSRIPPSPCGGAAGRRSCRGARQRGALPPDPARRLSRSPAGFGPGEKLVDHLDVWPALLDERQVRAVLEDHQLGAGDPLGQHGEMSR